MKIISESQKSFESERLQCPFCECIFDIQIPDLYDIQYTAKGKTGAVNCPGCKLKLRVYQEKCVNPAFKFWFSIQEHVPKHCL